VLKREEHINLSTFHSSMNLFPEQITFDNLESIFIISPVRKSTPENELEIKAYQRALQATGIESYYPLIDTNQNDSVGLTISKTNKEAIKKRDEVHIYYEQTSRGSFFDTGMSFYFNKPAYFINEDEMASEILPQGKNNNHIYSQTAFAEFIRAYAYNVEGENANRFTEDAFEQREKISKTNEPIPFTWDPQNSFSTFLFGMIYASGKEMLIQNRADLRFSEGKVSFDNMLINLDFSQRKNLF